MDSIPELASRLDENGRISQSNYSRFLTKISAPWLFTVSTALSFEYEEEFSRNQLDYLQLFGCAEFALTPQICDHLRHTIEHVFNQMTPEMTQIDILWKQLEDIKCSWLNSPNDFARHMKYIAVLAKEVMSAFNWYEWVLRIKNFNQFDHEQYHLLQRFDSEVIGLVRYNLTSAAYDIVNNSNYGKGGPKMIEASDIFILYFVFDIFPHSITVARSDPEKFANSLMYRTKFDSHVYDCLLELTGLQEVITGKTNFGHLAIDDMLNNLGASLLARILLWVYSDVLDPENGDTFLHLLLSKKCTRAFIELFPHCEELWAITNSSSLTPMGFFFHLNGPPFHTDLNILFQCVSHNADFFASLV